MAEVQTNTSLDALIQLIQQFARTQPQVISDGGAPYLLQPNDHNILALEHTLPRPVTARGSSSFSDLASLVGYVNEEKDETTRAYYVAKPTPALVVVLNDTRRQIARPPEGSAFATTAAEGDRITSWRDLRASFAYPLSEEWTRWTTNSGKKMTQTDFALFIEQNLPDIADPTGDVMLTVAKSLEAKKDVQFASAIRLEDGSTEFKFEETVQGLAAKGTMAVPTNFSLGIPVFENGDAYRVPAFLRYRIQGSTLSLWYDLDRPHKVLDHALTSSIETFRAATGVPVYRGTPASANRT